jgi:hypothetical protein
MWNEIGLKDCKMRVAKSWVILREIVPAYRLVLVCQQDTEHGMALLTQ